MHEPHYLTEEELQELTKGERLISENGAPYLVVSNSGDKEHPQLLMDSYPWDTIHYLLPKLFRDRRVLHDRRIS